MKKESLKTLKSLRSNDDVLITKSYKDPGVVVINQDVEPNPNRIRKPVLIVTILRTSTRIEPVKIKFVEPETELSPYKLNLPNLNQNRNFILNEFNSTLSF